MKMIDADELKNKKEYNTERHEWIIPVAAIDWIKTRDVLPVVHGSWIYLGATPGGSMILKCSACNKVRRGSSKSKYCRDCGAKMDGETI